MSESSADRDPSLPVDIGQCHEIIRTISEKYLQQQALIESLQNQINHLMRSGRNQKREYFDPGQGELFEEPEPEPEPVIEPEPEPIIEPESPTCLKGHGRKRPLTDLPRQRVVIDLEPEQQTCSCCHQPLTRIGEVISSRYEYKPASIFVLEFARQKYACQRCLDRRPADNNPVPVNDLIRVAEPPANPIPKGNAGPGLLAFILVSKFVDHLPLHRLERFFQRGGLKLSRSTMCSWLGDVAQLLEPLYCWMLADLLQSRVIHIDETSLPLQKKDNQRQLHPARMWVAIGDALHPHLIYDFTLSKARAGPEAMLNDYNGYLQADAANLYDQLYTRQNMTEVACWAHARRKFHEAQSTAPLQAARAMVLIGKLYRIEKEIKKYLAEQSWELALQETYRLQIRQEKVIPVLKELHEWLNAEAPKLLPKSPIAKAVNYALRHWQALHRYTEQGYLNIDNNAAERALRVVALGRKNWLFAGSEQGGRNAAIIYSIVQSCLHVGVEPQAYLTDILAKLPTWHQDRLSELSPAAWKQQQSHTILNPSTRF